MFLKQNPDYVKLSSEKVFNDAIEPLDGVNICERIKSR